MVLGRTVEPGLGGQSFIPSCADKVCLIREKINETGFDVDLQVDGGINADTVDIVKKAGAHGRVAGSYLFKAENMKEAANRLRAEVC